MINPDKTWIVRIVHINYSKAGIPIRKIYIIVLDKETLVVSASVKIKLAYEGGVRWSGYVNDYQSVFESTISVIPLHLNVIESGPECAGNIGDVAGKNTANSNEANQQKETQSPQPVLSNKIV